MLSVQELIAEAKSDVNCLTKEESATLAKQDGVLVVDLREPAEHEESALPIAVHLPRGVLEFKIGDASTGLDQEILLHCGGGGRASLAALSLQKMGYNNVSIVNAPFSEFLEEYNK